MSIVGLADCPYRIEHRATESVEATRPVPPGSFGEIGVPAVAPALANAVFVATGKRIRTRPISREGIVIA
jgi:CO/xanthine dehydrogenase Mo-binding subunit